MRALFEAVVKTGSGALGALFFGVITTKILSLVLGPMGIGLYSLIQQVRQVFQSPGTISGGVPVVQGVSSRGGEERSDFINSIFYIMLFLSVFCSLGVVIFASEIAETIFGKNDLETISLIKLLSLPIFFGVLLAFFKGVMNGYRLIGFLALVNVLVAATAAILAFPVADSVKSGNELSFIWLLSVASGVGLVMVIVILWRKGVIHSMVAHKVSFRQRWKLSCCFLSISSIMVITGLAEACKLLAVRSLLVQELGLYDAGIFAVSWTLCMMYVGLIIQTFGTYYLPSLSSISNPEERVDLIRNVLRLAMLIMVPVIIAVVVLKPFIIHVLYSNEFLPSLEIIRWMLIGDFFKITSWVLGYTILAYADVRTLLWSELLFILLELFGVYIAITHYESLEGIGMVFMLSYIAHALFTFVYCYSRHGFTLTTKLLWHWLIGLGLLLFASWYSWCDTGVDWMASFVWVFLASCLTWLMLSHSEKTKVFKRLMFKK